jgi:hypothetical protein
MDMAGNEPQLDAGDGTESLAWRIHPVVERPLQGAMLIGIMAFCTWVFWSGYGPYYGIFCLAVLVFSMLPFFLPTSYELDGEGVEITSLFFVRHFRPWSDFRSFYSDKVGVQLSPFAKPSRLAVFRGNFVRFSVDNRDRVIAFLDEHIRQKRIRERTDDEA